MIHIADHINKIVNEYFIPKIEEVFGDEGLNAVFNVLNILHELYKHVEPERIRGHVIIFQVVQPHSAAPPSAVPTVDFAGLANQNIDHLFIEVASDGRPYARTLEATTIEQLAERAIVYHYYDTNEKFLAGPQRLPVLRIDPSARSQFSVPTFSNLRDALQNYAREHVRESSCKIFLQVWYDTNRLFLKAGPESWMRDSLELFLRNRIGADYEVWPEQNVNEKNPVDIRVQPRFQNNRLMLIEIKWLGDSSADDGHITVQHRDSRAREGVDQLAGYIDEQRRSAPSRVIQGFYVIIDARRRNLPADATATLTITRADGMYYENQEIDFNSAPQLTRDDFDEPYRMFARPKCCD